MAMMLALVYNDQDTGKRAYSTVESLESAGYVTILDSALLLKDKYGSIDVDKGKHPVRRGATAGAVIGGMLGLVFLAPVVGAAAGAAVGGAVSSGTDSGHREFKHFADSVKLEIPAGGSALVLLGHTDARDRVVHDLGSYGGRLMSFDVSEAELAAVQKEVDVAAKQAGIVPPTPS